MFPFWMWFLVVPGAALLLVRLLRQPVRRLGYRMAVRTRRQLGYRLNPITVTRKQRLKRELLQDEVLGASIRELAAAQRVDEGDLLARASLFLDEIIPQFNLLTTHRVGRRLAGISLRAFYRIRVGRAAEAELNAIPRHASVVFVMNHRSNADYLLVAFLLSSRVAVSYAVGEWARVWPLESLFKSFGAYFIRRNFRDPLYHRVLERYVQRAVEAGIPQGIFPEGGLSRDGSMQPPKLGILDYMVRSGARDLVFIPVGINFDRVMEDSNLIRETHGLPRRGPLAHLRRTAFWILGLLFRTATGRFFRCGYAVANFGPPIRVHEVLGEVEWRGLDWEGRKPFLKKLGVHLMQAVAHEIPLTPVPVVAWSFLSLGDREVDRDGLRTRVLAVREWAQGKGLPLFPAKASFSHFFESGLRTLLLRGILLEREGLLTPSSEKGKLLDYYARSIQHHNCVFPH